MIWRNPDFRADEGAQNHPGTARLCVVQYQMHKISAFKDFAQQYEHFVGTASEYRSDFCIFPELLTTQLFSMLPSKRPQDAARALNDYTEQYLELFNELSIRYNVNIIGGSHLIIEEEKLYNVAYLFRRDGTIEKQYKIHVTPSEEKWWGVAGGERVQVFVTDRGKIAILICYDIEFPDWRGSPQKRARILSSFLITRTCGPGISGLVIARMHGPLKTMCTLRWRGHVETCRILRRQKFTMRNLASIRRQLSHSTGKLWRRNAHRTRKWC